MPSPNPPTTLLLRCKVCPVLPHDGKKQEVDKLQGQIQASLTSLSRTIDDYAELAKGELVPTKQEKAMERIKNFRTDLADYRQTFSRLKKDREEAVCKSPSRSPPQTTPKDPQSNKPTPANDPQPHRPLQPSTPPHLHPRKPLRRHRPLPQLPLRPPFQAQQPLHRHPHRRPPPEEYTREQHAFREQTFMSTTNAALDEYLERGRAVLGDLGQQREMLKGTQKKLYSVANTLGVSGDTIRMVERRARQDKWVFWVGCVVFFGFCWVVVHFLR